MAVGIKYTVPQAVEHEIWNQKTSYRLQGGFNLVIDNLTEGAVIQPAVPLHVDFKTRKATVAKSVKVIATATDSDTKIKVAKGSLAYVGMFLGNGTKGGKVTAIDKSNADYDEITVGATLGVALKVGDILFEASAVGGTTLKVVPNTLNFTRVVVEEGATVTALGKAYEIRESKLYQPISEKEKTALGDRFLFVNF